MDIPLKNFQQELNQGGNSAAIANLYADGIIKGLEAANAELAVEKQPPLFCEPPDFSLTTEQAIDILDRWVSQNQEGLKAIPLKEQLTEELMLYALKSTFPCK